MNYIIVKTLNKQILCKVGGVLCESALPKGFELIAVSSEINYSDITDLIKEKQCTARFVYPIVTKPLYKAMLKCGLVGEEELDNYEDITQEDCSWYNIIAPMYETQEKDIKPYLEYRDTLSVPIYRLNEILGDEDSMSRSDVDFLNERLDSNGLLLDISDYNGEDCSEFTVAAQA